MDTVQILKEARALIADEENWTQGDYAQDKDGNQTMPSLSEATCFCAVGAIHRVGRIKLSQSVPLDIISVLAIDEAVDRTDVGISESAIIGFNDTHTHADVLALFDRAIARAESEAA